MSDRKKEEQSSEPSWLEIGMGFAAIGSAAYLFSKVLSSNATPSVSPNSHCQSDMVPILSSSSSYNNHRANQCNPNHTATGPGRSAGYHGSGSKADLDNHSRQLNPQDPKYHG